MTDLITQVGLGHWLGLSAACFAVGLAGVLIRRNVIVVLMCLELMLNAVNMTLVAFSRAQGDLHGQVAVFFSIAVAAAEVAVGLVIVILLHRRRRSVETDDFRSLRN